jgi:predicted nucleic acid-binding protein
VGSLSAACFDSDVVIDYLQGRAPALELLESWSELHMSIATWIEVMTGATRGGIGTAVRRALADFTVHPVTGSIAERAVALRSARRLRTPDAMIWATALHLGIPLVTRNTRDFPADDPMVIVPYRL